MRNTLEEWHRATTMKPKERLSFADYQELVTCFGKIATTHDRASDEEENEEAAYLRKWMEAVQEEEG